MALAALRRAVALRALHRASAAAFAVAPGLDAVEGARAFASVPAHNAPFGLKGLHEAGSAMRLAHSAGREFSAAAAAGDSLVVEVPPMGDSISEGVIATIEKQPGETRSFVRSSVFDIAPPSSFARSLSR